MQYIPEAAIAILSICAAFGALICVAAAACRLRKMQPGRVTKWAWLWIYVAVFVLAWTALAHLINGEATALEKCICIVAATYLWLTIPSWQNIPAIARVNYGRRATDRLGSEQPGT